MVVITQSGVILVLEENAWKIGISREVYDGFEVNFEITATKDFPDVTDPICIQIWSTRAPDNKAHISLKIFSSGTYSLNVIINSCSDIEHILSEIDRTKIYFQINSDISLHLGDFNHFYFRRIMFDNNMNLVFGKLSNDKVVVSEKINDLTQMSKEAAIKYTLEVARRAYEENCIR